MANIADKFWRTQTGKQLLLSAFRLLALATATIELALGPEEYTFVSRPLAFSVAVLYTAFKISHPLRWYRSARLGPLLITIDVMMGLALVAIPGEIHMPFSLYSVVAVLTSALLLSRRSTFVIAGVTAAGYTAAYFSHPFPVAMENISTNLAAHLVVVALISILPYAVNSVSQQQLRSAATLSERQRLAREIHDGICQSVSGLRWRLRTLRSDGACTGQFAQQVAQIEELLRKAEVEARGSIESLRACEQERPLFAQLEDSLDRLRSDTGIDGHLAVQTAEPALDDLVRHQVVYICEEALRNVAKHSEALHVTVTVRAPNGHLELDVADDGRGFDGARFAPGHGLMVMKERAESIGGRLEALSMPGRGTRILVEVPRRCPLETVIAGR